MTAAQADTYVSVSGGRSFAPDLQVGATKSDGYRLQCRRPRRHHPGNWNLPNFSVEADGLFNQSTYSGPNNARLQSSSYMGNLIYHMPTDTPFSVYGGAGLGAVNTNIDNGIGNHGGSTVLGWQALGGVEYRASEWASLFAEYRYQDAHNVMPAA